ncbi:hypothetical protein CROQUDRAFT_98612 [Cronartium quercuum f. sp. fusiforme G11]|uniref:Uncharacterized protein n=1 Tax=Cronartium quercuum f. sp. fusiforme G11 TaxID=708437 RepID=A0A9P6T7G4_9BASI|nr:hypothetical protein CROQUDRAFT_98612 [Cronartium quercuum f. sp. fusiforme G11]
MALSTFSENQYDKEIWRTGLTLRGSSQCEIYDMTWSPCGDFLLTRDTAKTARIWNVTDGLSSLDEFEVHSSCQSI